MVLLDDLLECCMNGMIGMTAGAFVLALALALAFAFAFASPVISWFPLKEPVPEDDRECAGDGEGARVESAGIGGGSEIGRW